MHLPYLDLLKRQDDTATLISIVVVTADPTPKNSKPSPPPQQSFQPQPTLKPTPTPTPHTSKKSTPTSKHTTRATVLDSSISETPTQEPSHSNANGALASITESSSPTATASPGEEGMSSATKAGIAIGVLLGLAFLVGGGFLFARLAKKRQEKKEDEKAANPFGDSAAAPPPKVTRGFTPPPVPPMSDFPRPSTSGTNGPFGGSSSIAPSDGSMKSAAAPEPPVNPFGEHAQIGSQSSFNSSLPTPTIEERNHFTPSPMSQDSDKEIIGAAIGGAAVGALAGGTTNGTTTYAERRQSVPKPLELDGSRPILPFANPPASPAPSQFSFTSTAPTVAGSTTAGGNGAADQTRPPSNVYRVQLDFQPSMHDEMELRTGELVRMLHEYDDGWSLCVKFDKSARGVCPRTCLSQKPLQPRPRNGPRPGTGPQGMHGPQQDRTASPAPSNGPRSVPNGRASPAPSAPRLGGPPSRTASPAPPGTFPTSRSASPAPSSGINPNLNNWPAKPINASTITPNMNNWPAQPVNAPNMTQRSMSPGPYGGASNGAQRRPDGPSKRRSHSLGNFPLPGQAQELETITTSVAGSDDFHLPLQGANATSPVARKPLPGNFM